MCKCGSSDFRAVLSPPDVELICPIRPCSRTAMQGTLGGDSSLCNIRPKSLVSVITQEGPHGRIWQPMQSCSSSLGHREQWLLVLITMGVSSSLAKEKNPGSQDWRSEIICSGICSSYWGLQKSPGDSNECEGSRIKDQDFRATFVERYNSHPGSQLCYRKLYFILISIYRSIYWIYC